MSISDKNKILLNSSCWASPNIKSRLELRDNDTSLLATNRDTLNCNTFQVHTFTVNLLLGLQNRMMVADKVHPQIADVAPFQRHCKVVQSDNADKVVSIDVD
ncbi:hypothetical protein Lal_00024879 [Lupinus albus]|nr:hypothetical protein Lal_00024879 [Lupinus albus]